MFKKNTKEENTAKGNNNNINYSILADSEADGEADAVIFEELKGGIKNNEIYNSI